MYFAFRRYQLIISPRPTYYLVYSDIYSSFLTVADLYIRSVINNTLTGIQAPSSGMVSNGTYSCAIEVSKYIISDAESELHIFVIGSALKVPRN